MAEVHAGGCLCGRIRFRVTGDPVRTSVCHCAFCQRRTGSAFAVLPFFKAEAVELTGEPPATYRHISDESGRWLEIEFCPRCGTNIGLRVERAPQGRIVAGGCFDDPRWFSVDRHIWTRSKLPWVALPEGCVLEETG
jgi:hypothetical protein